MFAKNAFIKNMKNLVSTARIVSLRSCHETTRRCFYSRDIAETLRRNVSIVDACWHQWSREGTPVKASLIKKTGATPCLYWYRPKCLAYFSGAWYCYCRWKICILTCTVRQCMVKTALQICLSVCWFNLFFCRLCSDFKRVFSNRMTLALILML